MRNFLLGILITVVVVLTYKQCTSANQVPLKASSQLIQQQIEQVSKLVVMEGNFSEVFNYENSKEIFGDYLTADKRALVVVNAKVTVGYDLKQLTYIIDEASKTLEILNIPDQEVSISPDLQYYDIQSDFLNPFDAEDYNAIDESVRLALMNKIENSSLKTNAENRLISELARFFVLTESLGWTLKYKSKAIENRDQLNDIKL